MRRITHREMRNQSGEVLRAVAAGESVQVTNNGLVAAVISPPPASTYAQLVAAGAVREARRPVQDLLLLERGDGSLSAEQVLADVRGAW